MRTACVVALILLSAACSNEKVDPAFRQLSKEPISVRGWIADIDTGQPSTVYRTVETEAARRAQSFQATNLWVENAPYVSGGVAENGAFVLLDVPPGKAIVSFSAPGVPSASVVVENVPGNADVLIPGLILKPGAVAIADPKAIQVRIAAKISRPGPTGMTARVAGFAVPVIQVPINSLMERHDYPTPPETLAPVATVK